MYADVSQARTTIGGEGRQTSAVVDEAEALVPQLLSIAKSTRAMVGIELAKIGLYQGQDELLMVLDRDAPVAVSTLADRLGVRPSTVSKMLDRLVGAGFVERIPCERDARSKLVRATEEGSAMKPRVCAVWLRIEKSLTAKLVDREFAALQCELGHLDRVLKTRLARLR